MYWRGIWNMRNTMCGRRTATNTYQEITRVVVDIAYVDLICPLLGADQVDEYLFPRQSKASEHIVKTVQNPYISSHLYYIINC